MRGVDGWGEKASFVIVKLNTRIFPTFILQVNILENRNLTYLHVPELRRHEISVDENASDSLKGVRVERKGGWANIRYRPNVSDLQRRLKSKHALQFVVEYDVDRPDKAGEIQVEN